MSEIPKRPDARDDDHQAWAAYWREEAERLQREILNQDRELMHKEQVIMRQMRELSASEAEVGRLREALEPLCLAVEEYCGESLWPRTRLREAVAKGRAALGNQGALP